MTVASRWLDDDRLIARWFAGVLVVLCAACGTYLAVPAVLEKTEQGTVMQLSVAAPVREQQVQAVIDRERPNGSPVPWPSGAVRLRCAATTRRR